MRLLLVEDNTSLAGNIADFMELKGHSVDYAGNGKQCLNLVKSNDYDVIILDVMMPGIDGYETCRFMRNTLHCQIPIIFLTAKVEIEHKLEGFEVGGDDYLTKPFEMEELYCRLRVLSSRGPRSDIGLLSFGDLSLDMNTGSVVRQGKEIKVNNVQFRILQILIKHAPAIVSRRDLEYEIWGDEIPDSDVLRTHIYRLRSLVDKSFDKQYIETIHSKGFRLKEPE